jgi:outer membrane protein TolC
MISTVGLHKEMRNMTWITLPRTLATAAFLAVAAFNAVPQTASAQGTNSAASSSVVSPKSTGELNSPASAQNVFAGPLVVAGIGQGGSIALTTAPANGTYTLSSAIQQALQASSDLSIAQTDLQRDRALVAVAADAAHPKINASGTVTHLDSPIAIAFGGQSIVVQPENTEAFDAMGTLPIDISGEIQATTQAAQLQAMADRFNLDRVRDALILNTQTTYFNLLRAQHQLQVAQSAVTDAQTQLNTAQTQFNGGIGQKIDVYRASTQVAQAQQNLLQAQNALSLQENNFNDVVGRPLDAPVTVEDVSGVTVGATVTQNGQESAVGAPDASVSQFYAPAPTVLNQIDLQKDIKTALSARPELRSDQVNVSAAAKQIMIARAENAPSLSLGATGDYYPVTDFQTPRHSLGVFTATLNIPIYDGGETNDQVRADRDNQRNAETTYASDQTTVQLQVRQTYLNLFTSSNQIAAANTALQQAIAARQLAQVRYANGVGLYLEVTDAEAALTSAENSQVNAVYDYLIARAQYENAIGIPASNPTL